MKITQEAPIMAPAVVSNHEDVHRAPDVRHVATVVLSKPGAEIPRVVTFLQGPSLPHLKNMFYFPGGEVESGESPVTAAKRHVKRKTGLTGVSDFTEIRRTKKFIEDVGLIEITVFMAEHPNPEKARTSTAEAVIARIQTEVSHQCRGEQEMYSSDFGELLDLATAARATRRLSELALS